MLYKYSPYYLFILVIFIAIALLPSCTYTAKDIETRKFKAHPVPSNQVQIVNNQEDVAHCHYVALLKARRGLDASFKTRDRSKEIMINKLRKEAGKLGANVLHIIGIEPGELTTEDVGEAILGYIVVTIVVGALTGDVVEPSSPSESDSLVAKAYYCE